MLTHEINERIKHAQKKSLMLLSGYKTNRVNEAAQAT